MRSWLFTIAVLVSLDVMAQEPPREEINLQRLVDDIMGTQDGNENAEALYENLALILSNPLDVNQATEEQLRFLSILTEAQLSALLAYRNENKLLSLYELQAIPELDSTTIKRITPFLTVQVASESINMNLIKRILHEKNNYFLIRYERTLERKQGFIENDPSKKFIGSADKMYYRFRTSRPGDFSLGFTMEKDAGESITWNPSAKQYGFDFISAHIQLQNKGRLNNLIIGDYQIQAGQGLVLGGAFGFGKGGETITTIRRSNIGALPYTSTNENGNFSGAMATIKLTDHVNLTSFLSLASRDASIESDSANEFISGFQNTGYHRNLNELAKRKIISEYTYGGILQFHQQNLDVGIITSATQFEHPINRSPRLYNGYAFKGSSNTNASIYLNYNLNNFTLFSEAAKTLEGGYGVVAGILGSLTTNFDVSFAFRKYQRDYISFFTNAFSEASVPQNETGLYYGWKYRWSKRIELAGYVDLFKFPWLRFRNYAPSDGFEWLARLNYKPTSSSIIYLQYRQEKKDRNSNQENIPTYRTVPGVRQNILANYQVKASKYVSLKTRAQFSTYAIDKHYTSGMALIQDVRFTLNKVSATMRYAVFDTEDYDNRQYVYEDDVWLAFSIPAYYGQGVRNYIMLSYDLNTMFSFWLRYSHTRLQHEDSIGSGVDAVYGNQRSDIKFQIRMRL